MKAHRSIPAILIASILALSCSVGTQKFENNSGGFDRFLEKLAQDYIDLKPHLVASTGNLDRHGVDTPPLELPSFDDRKLLREFRWAEKSSKTLRSFDASSLSRDQRIYQQILDYWFSDVLAAEEFYYHDYLIDHFFGIQVALPEFFDIVPVGSEEEAGRYIFLLEEVPAAVDGWLEACRVREKKNLVPPTIIIQQVINQMRSFVFMPVEENLMFASFSQALDGIGGLSDAQRDAFRSEVKELISKEVHPAFKAAIEYLSDLKKTGKSIAVGLLELPEGEAYYQFLLNHYTTLKMTPDEVHQLGLAEMERIEAEITGLLVATGRETDIPAALSNIGGEVFSGREAIFAEYENIIADIKQALPSQFITLPEKRIALERVPAFKENVAGNFYYTASLDDSRPGRFIMNLSYAHPKSFMLHLAFHETIPGHHLQLARTIENPAVPLVLKLLIYEETQFIGFIEGWALYAETLASEQGFYDKPEYTLGYLSAMLTRAARLVVDTGLHAKGWSIKEAEQFYTKHFGYARIGDVYRYMAIPGQGCAYTAGYLQILGLRETARQQRGEDFDIRQFHESLLSHGAVPLNLLEAVAGGTGPR